MTTTATTTTAPRFEVDQRVHVEYCTPGSMAHEHWSGPATVQKCDEYLVTVLTDNGEVGAFDPANVTPLSSTVVHSVNALAALPAGTIIEDVGDDYGDIAIVTDVEGELFYETIAGDPFNAILDPGMLKLPALVLNPEILDEPELVTEAHGYKLGDEVTVITDAFKINVGIGERGTVTNLQHDRYVMVDTEGGASDFPFLPKEIEKLARLGGFAIGDCVEFVGRGLRGTSASPYMGKLGTVVGFEKNAYLIVDADDGITDLNGWCPERFEHTTISDAAEPDYLDEPLADWELVLLHFASVEPTFEVGDTVFVPKDAKTAEGYGVYFYQDVEATITDIGGMDILVKGESTDSGVIEQYVGPKSLKLVRKANTSPEVVSNDELIGATVEDAEVIDSFNEGTVLLTPAGNPRLRTFDNGWVGANHTYLPVSMNEYLTVLHIG